MQLKEFKEVFQKELLNLYPLTEINSFFFLLIDEYLGLQKIDTVLKPDFEITENQLSILNSAKERLKKEEPIQYIIGKTEFYGLQFFVNKNTLIPRPETEELVSWIIESVKKHSILNKKENISILDIGTGSGCIAVSLAKKIANADVNAIDISKEALQIANKNASQNDVTIHLEQKNILKTQQLEKKFDIIVANPPYVRNLEKKEIKNNVLLHEPSLALFVENDNALIFYEAISKLAKDNLDNGGLLFFEINQYLGNETMNLVKSIGFKDLVLRKDLFGNNRMLKAYQ